MGFKAPAGAGKIGIPVMPAQGIVTIKNGKRIMLGRITSFAIEDEVPYYPPESKDLIAETTKIREENERRSKK